MASWFTMTARRAATFARISTVTRCASSVIPRRGLAGIADHHGSPPQSPSKWKKGHSLIVSFAACGLLSFGGYKLFTEARNNRTNYAQEFSNADDSEDLTSTTDNSLMDLLESWIEENVKTYRDSSLINLFESWIKKNDQTYMDNNSRMDLFKTYTVNNSLMDLFELWTEKNGKTYKGPEEKIRRFEIFKANVKYVVERNKALTRRKVGLNHFSDLDREDFVQARYLKDLFEWWIENIKGMSYESPEEKLFRFECFRDRVKFIEEMNKELTSFRVGLTSRADVGYEEPRGCKGCRMDRENLSRKM